MIILKGANMFILISAVVFGLSGVICHQLAKSRGRNPVNWGVAGVVFGPVAIPFVLMSRNLQEK
jgi:hypothetical protein